MMVGLCNSKYTKKEIDSNHKATNRLVLLANYTKLWIKGLPQK